MYLRQLLWMHLIWDQNNHPLPLIRISIGKNGKKHFSYVQIKKRAVPIIKHLFVLFILGRWLIRLDIPHFTIQ